MKNILQKIFLFYAIFLFNWGYGQVSTCNNPIAWTTQNFSNNNLVVTSSTYFIGISTIDYFDDKNNIKDNNYENYSSWTPLLLGNEFIEIQNNQKTFPAGTYAGFVLTDYQAVALGSTYTVETLMNNRIVNSVEVSVPIQSLTTQNRNIGVVSTGSFNKIRLKISTLGASTFNIYYAYTIEPCSTSPELNCNSNTPITQTNYSSVINYDNERTGTSGLTVGNITNLNNIVNSDSNDYATMTLGASVGASAQVSVRDLQRTYEAGSFAGFEISNSNLLNLNLLNGSTIVTYLNGVEQERSNSGNLLVNLTLLGANNKANLGFITTKSFNEVQYIQNNLLGLDVFGSTQIYNMIVRKLCEGPDLTCNQRTILDDSIYPISISGNTGVEGLISLGSVTEPRNAIDNDPTTYASMNIRAGALSKATLAIKKSLSPYPANTYVSFEVENSSLLNLSVLSNYGIRLLRNGVQVGIAEGNNLLVGANLLGSSRKTIGFKAPAEFDEIQLIINNAGLSADLGVTKVHNVKVMQPCAVPIVCDEEYVLNDTEFPVVINALRTGPTSAACVGCSAKNPENILSSDNTDFATLNIPVGLLSGVSVSVEDLATVYPAGTKVGFTVNDVPGILQLDLLESLQITTYLNGVPQETASAAELIDLSLIFNLVGSGTKNYGFQTTKSFDEVQLTVFSVLNAFNEMKVYNLRFDTKNSNGEGLICIGNPFAEDDTFTLNPGQTSTTSVVDNDVSNNLPAVIGQNVQISQISSSNPDIILNSNGQVVVGANVLPGIYQLEYRICNIDSPSSCDTAIIQVIVKGVNDIDGDGIPDDIDLDNDNDGILDINENNCDDNTPKVTTEIYRQDFGYKSLDNGTDLSSYIFPNAYNENREGHALVGIREGGLSLQEGTSELNYKNTNPLKDGNYTLAINSSFVDDFEGSYNNQWSNTNSPYKGLFDHTVGDISPNTNPGYMLIANPLNNTQIIWTSPLIDIKSYADVEVKLWIARLNKATAGGEKPDLSIQVYGNMNDIISNAAPISSLNTGQIDLENEWTESKLTLKTGNINQIYIVIRSHEVSSQGNDFAIDDIVISESLCDFDGDGIPNVYDTDSDNDGCFDAIEGGDNVKPEQLKANGEINSPVDATGVPTLVNVGGAADVNNDQGQSNNNGKPYNAADTSECPTFCVKPGDRSTNGTPSIIGISTLSKQLQTWPENIPNGFIALESKEKGFVITTVNNVNTILDPKPGMIVYDNSEGAKCIKLYSNSGPGNTYQWKCIERTCNQ